MSRKERNRLVIMAQVKHRKLSLGQSADVLHLSYRQVKRVWRRYQTQGDAGLVHRLRGRPSARRKAPELRARILARYRSQYADFGPTLAAEYLLEEDQLEVDHETLRRWLMAEGIWQTEAAATAASTVAGAQGVPGADGATGWVAPRLV